MGGIVLLCAIAAAVFVFFKLYMVLGTRTGTEKPPVDVFRKPQDVAKESPADKAPVITFPKSAAEPVIMPTALNGLSAEVADSIKAFLSIDPNFDTQEFMDGAQLAYEYIINAYAKADLAQLKPLLAKDVYENFAAAIKERKAEKHTLETTLVGMDKTTLLEASLKGSTASLTVEYQLKLIHVTRNEAGEVVDGDPQAILDVVDVWTFSRDLKSKNPNWLLVATEAMDETFA